MIHKEQGEIEMDIENAILRSREVSGVTGATMRMLQNWDEKGYLRPQQSKHTRRYTYDQTVFAGVLANLTARRFTWNFRMLPMRSIATALKENPTLVVILKRRVIRCHTSEETVFALAELKEGAILVDVEEIGRKIRECVMALIPEKGASER